MIDTPTLQWRITRLAELGFSHDQAVILADTRNDAGFLVDLYEIGRWLEQGCEHRTVVAIVA